MVKEALKEACDALEILKQGVADRFGVMGQKLLHEHADDPNYKGIIFVEQVALTFPLMDLLNRSLGPALGVGCVLGASACAAVTTAGSSS